MAATANSNSRVVVKRVHGSKIALKLQVAASAHAKLATSRPAQNGGVAASWQCFLVKLFRLLDDADNAKLISWDESGTSIIVFDATKPSLDRVLVLSGCGFDGVKTPMANFSSVLSKYGFKQQALTFKPGVRKRAEKIQFTHAYILRDTPLSKIRALSMREAYRLGKGACPHPSTQIAAIAAGTGSHPVTNLEHPPVVMMPTPTKVPSSVHSHNDTGVGSPHSAINNSNAYTYSPGYTMDSLKGMPPPPGVDIGIGTIKDEELKAGIQPKINLHWQAHMDPLDLYGGVSDAGAHTSDLSVYEVQPTPWYSPMVAPRAVALGGVDSAHPIVDRLNLSPPTFGLIETVTEPTPPAIGGSDTVAESVIDSECDNKEFQSTSAKQVDSGSTSWELKTPPETTTECHGSRPDLSLTVEASEHAIPTREFIAMPGFLPRLFQIAGDPTNKDVIRWNPTGDIVVLVDLLKVAALGISTTDEGKQYQGQFRGHGFRHVVIESQGKVLFGWKHRVINRHFPLEKLDSLSAKDAMRLGS